MELQRPLQHLKTRFPRRLSGHCLALVMRSSVLHVCLVSTKFFTTFCQWWLVIKFSYDFFDKLNPFMLLECCNLTSPFSNLGVLDGISIFANFDRTLLLANSEDPTQTAHHAVLILACTVRLSPIQKDAILTPQNHGCLLPTFMVCRTDPG